MICTFYFFFSRKPIVLMNYWAYKALWSVYIDLNKITLKDWDPRFKTDLDFFKGTRSNSCNLFYSMISVSYADKFWLGIVQNSF